MADMFTVTREQVVHSKAAYNRGQVIALMMTNCDNQFIRDELDAMTNAQLSDEFLNAIFDFPRLADIVAAATYHTKEVAESAWDVFTTADQFAAERTQA